MTTILILFFCDSEDFFPKEVDFSQLFGYEGDQMNSYDMDMDDIISLGTGQNTPAVSNKLSNNSNNKVIMIPPLMPRSSAPLFSNNINDKNLVQPLESKSGKKKHSAASAAVATSSASKKKTKSMMQVEEEDLDDDFDEANMTDGQRFERRYVFSHK